MNKSQKTLAIVLRRTNFGEADRIVNFLTPSGKIVAVARGARKQKSKIAGGIEAFSLNEVVFAEGKSEMKMIISARMKEHFGEIVKSLDRMEFGYLVIQKVSKACEHIDSTVFFENLLKTLVSLNDPEIDLGLIRAWFELNLAAATGDEINLEIDNLGEPLYADKTYDFDFFEKVFVARENGKFGANHIKFLRLMLASEPRILRKVVGGGQILRDLTEVISAISGNCRFF